MITICVAYFLMTTSTTPYAFACKSEAKPRAKTAILACDAAASHGGRAPDGTWQSRCEAVIDVRGRIVLEWSIGVAMSGGAR